MLKSLKVVDVLHRGQVRTVPAITPKRLRNKKTHIGNSIRIGLGLQLTFHVFTDFHDCHSHHVPGQRVTVRKGGQTWKGSAHPMGQHGGFLWAFSAEKGEIPVCPGYSDDVVNKPHRTHGSQSESVSPRSTLVYGKTHERQHRESYPPPLEVRYRVHHPHTRYHFSITQHPCVSHFPFDLANHNW